MDYEWILLIPYGPIGMDVTMFYININRHDIGAPSATGAIYFHINFFYLFIWII